MADELERLRREARRLHRNATRKISRNYVAREATISGSKYDPRRDLKKVDRYTAKQLQSYIDELKSFNARGTQFVPDSERRPVPKSVWDQAMEAQRKLNEYRREQYRKIKDIELPVGQTVEQYNAMTTPVHKAMENSPVNTLHGDIEKRSLSFRSESAMKKWVDKVYEMMTPEYRARIREANRKTTEDMLETIGDDDLLEQARNLTDAQIDFMYSTPAVIHDLGLVYQIYQDFYRSSQSEMRASDKRKISDHMKEVYDWFDFIRETID